MLQVYSKSNCPNCVLAKQLLDSYDIPYEVVDVEATPQAKEFLVWQGLRSVPQIFFNDELIPNGYAGLKAMESTLVEQFKDVQPEEDVEIQNNGDVEIKIITD